jgi:hypothetical protein
MYGQALARSRPANGACPMSDCLGEYRVKCWRPPELPQARLADARGPAWTSSSTGT